MSNERPLLFVARDLSGFLPALPVLAVLQENLVSQMGSVSLRILVDSYFNVSFRI